MQVTIAEAKISLIAVRFDKPLGGSGVTGVRGSPYRISADVAGGSVLRIGSPLDRSTTRPRRLPVEK